MISIASTLSFLRLRAIKLIVLGVVAISLLSPLPALAATDYSCSEYGGGDYGSCPTGAPSTTTTPSATSSSSTTATSTDTPEATPPTASKDTNPVTIIKAAAKKTTNSRQGLFIASFLLLFLGLFIFWLLLTKRRQRRNLAS